jgi:hypothetical protein
MMIISERDSLALEWELHQVRWLMNGLLIEVESTFMEQIRELPPHKERLEYGEMSREELIRWRQRSITQLPSTLETMISDHNAERDWWSKNKITAPINELRRAVRKKMASTGVSFPEGTLDTDRPEKAEERSDRWVLNVRAEIARRRMICGQAKLIADETLADHEWEKALTAIRVMKRPADWDYDEWDRQRTMSIEELTALVESRERSAASYNVTGDHLQPGWIHGN